jgi:hypothetical protein
MLCMFHAHIVMCYLDALSMKDLNVSFNIKQMLQVTFPPYFHG